MRVFKPAADGTMCHMLLTLIYILVCLNQLQVACESVQDVPAMCMSEMTAADSGTVPGTGL